MWVMAARAISLTTIVISIIALRAAVTARIVTASDRMLP
jgi:hypothetical protein